MDEAEFDRAQARGRARAGEPHAVSARYLPGRGVLVLALSTGAELRVPAALIQGLAGASAEELSTIEVSPAGLGLHFPRIDADVYVPALLEGFMGSRAWMARQDHEVGAASR